MAMTLSSSVSPALFHEFDEAFSVDPLSAATPERVFLLTVLREEFDTIPDPRVNRTKLHHLSDILLLSLAAVCCGAESFEDIADWADAQVEAYGVESLRRNFGLRLENGVPSHDTFERVFARVEPTVLEESLHLVRRHLPGAEASPRHIAIDGKELRGSRDAFHEQPATMLLSAYATESQVVLAQKKVDAKSNEIPAAVEVLSHLDIQGATITADALHCQRETARVIRERQGDYLLAVKDNQMTLHQAIIGLFATNREDKRLPMEVAQTLDKAHGRLEARQGFLIRVEDWLPKEDGLRKQWADLNGVLCLEYHRSWTQRGQPKTSTFTRYFISSSTNDVRDHMEFARSHWKIENSLHWLMDVTFGEDRSRARTGHQAQNLATLRRVAASLLKISDEGIKRKSIRGRKKIAGWSNAYLIRTLTI